MDWTHCYSTATSTVLLGIQQQCCTLLLTLKHSMSRIQELAHHTSPFVSAMPYGSLLQLPALLGLFFCLWETWQYWVHSCPDHHGASCRWLCFGFRQIHCLLNNYICTLLSWTRGVLWRSSWHGMRPVLSGLIKQKGSHNDAAIMGRRCKAVLTGWVCQEPTIISNGVGCRPG